MLEISADSVDQKDLVRRIEDDIYLGRLAPGMWLKQVDLEQKYGSTRLALRHALEQLTSRGLVQKVPNRGFYVPVFDAENVRLLRDARARIEMSIAADLVKLVPPDAIGRLRDLAKVFEETVHSGTVEQQDMANLAFHAELLKHSPNQVICELIWGLRRRIPLSIQRYDNTRQRLERAAQQHFAMVDALADRDVETFETLISEHIRG